MRRTFSNNFGRSLNAKFRRKNDICAPTRLRYNGAYDSVSHVLSTRYIRYDVVRIAVAKSPRRGWFAQNSANRTISNHRACKSSRVFCMALWRRETFSLVLRASRDVESEYFKRHSDNQLMSSSSLPTFSPCTRTLSIHTSTAFPFCDFQ